LRAICDKYGILLIFDEVMTGFGRMGKAFAYQRFNVVPDLLVFAKAVTNALIPMGGVLVPGRIRAAIQASAAQGAIEFMHGFTYSGHPVAAAAAIATLDLYARENLFEAAANLAPVLEDHLHGLADLPHVRDIRNIGLVGAVELHPRPGKPRQRGREVQQRAFDAGVLVRFVGDTIVLAPPLIISAEQIGQIVTTLREIISAVE
jgi:beta-alanine--pyruvate transaminase